MSSRTILGLATVLAAAAAVQGQAVLGEPVPTEPIPSGVEVPVTCTSCSCEGTTEGGIDVIVFDNPSTGNRIVSVDGELSEIFFQGCGWFFEVDDTLHWISGLDDLGSPELEVVDMTDDDGVCDRDRMGASATADCYSGTPDEKDFGDASMDLTLCLCTETDGRSTSWQSYVGASVTGTSSFDLQESEICKDNGFTSMTVDVTVNGESHAYNFDMVVPGEAGSAGLSVDPATTSAACVL